MKEALLYEKLADNRVRCHLCAHFCQVAEGKKGICQVRKNLGGTLYTQVYGRIISSHVDPVEKKPLYHFYPGSSAYSIATPGCNFHCQWCQNWEISQMPREQHLISGEAAAPEEIVAAAAAPPAAASPTPTPSRPSSSNTRSTLPAWPARPA